MPTFEMFRIIKGDTSQRRIHPGLFAQWCFRFDAHSEIYRDLKRHIKQDFRIPSRISPSRNLPFTPHLS